MIYLLFALMWVLLWMACALVLVIWAGLGLSHLPAVTVVGLIALAVWIRHQRRVKKS
jgi:hypothetical protein